MEDIKRNIEAVSNSRRENIICHLTGGFDSRLVASAVVKYGNKDDVYFYCSGPPSSIDKKIAHGLADEFNLKMSRFGGLIRDPVKSKKTVQNSVCFFSGMIERSPVNGEHKKNKNSLILSGGYGECYRSFYSKKSYSSVNSFWPKKKIILDEVEDKIDLLTEEYVASLQSKGLTEDQALDLMYVEQRNRYFVGNIAMHFSRKTPRFDPLYSINAVIAALMLEPTKRQDNYLGYQVMRSMDEGFLKKKFNSYKFGDTVFSEFPGAGAEVIENKSDYSFLYIKEGEGVYIPIEGKRKKLTSKHRLLAKKFKVKPVKILDFYECRDGAERLIDKHISSVDFLKFSKIVDPIYLKDIFGSKEPGSRVDLKSMLSIYVYLYFLSVQENPQLGNR